MSNLVLEVVDFSQDRDLFVIPRTSYLNNMAVGNTVSRLTLKSPSGKYWSVVVPNEMLEDLHPRLDVGDGVVPSRDQDSAATKEG
jgi:hypothetical protein